MQYRVLGKVMASDEQKWRRMREVFFLIENIPRRKMFMSNGRRHTKDKILELKTPVNIHENSKPNTHVNIHHMLQREVLGFRA